MDDTGRKSDGLIAELAILRGNALRQSELSLQVIVEATADGILAVDSGGKTIRANRRFADLWQIPHDIMDTRDDEAMLRYVLDQLDDPEAFLNKVNALYGTADEDMDELHFKDGRVFERYSAPLLLNGAVFGRVWSFRDITARRQAEEALCKSEEMYRLLTEISPSAVTVVDRSGAIRMVNRRTLDLYGYGGDGDVLGRSLFEWVAPEERGRASEAFGEFLVHGSLTNFELSLIRKDGLRFWGVANASLIRNPEGEPQLAIIVTTDISQQKELEEERLKLQKLESVGVLAGGIAHDFNNLLQGAFGYISMAKSSVGNGETAIELLEQAENALKMSINLTTQLLTFAKGGQPVRKKLAPVPVVDSAARFALSGARSGYRLNPADGIWKVFADEGQIGQAIRHIVQNAGEAMPQGGTVEISLANREIPPGGHQALIEGGRFVKIDIRDSGMGIPPRYLSRVFDPYFTTKEKGRGLGLATAFAIARNHHGTLEVSSEPGKGSTFSLYLPGSERGVEKATRLTAPSAGKKGRILVMDDEEVIRLVVARMVRLLGHEAECTEEGKDAVAKYREAHDAGNPFDAVILDLTIKGGAGGEEIAGQMLKIEPGARIVVSSGYADNQVLSDYRSYGFAACLVKPYTLEELRETLNEMLAQPEPIPAPTP